MSLRMGSSRDDVARGSWGRGGGSCWPAGEKGRRQAPIGTPSSPPAARGLSPVSACRSRAESHSCGISSTGTKPFIRTATTHGGTLGPLGPFRPAPGCGSRKLRGLPSLRRPRRPSTAPSLPPSTSMAWKPPPRRVNWRVGDCRVALTAVVRTGRVWSRPAFVVM
jgi:hypothetical protein